MRCVICGKKFEPKNLWHRCCSAECRKKLNNREVKKRYRYGKIPSGKRKCPICGKPFDARRPTQRCCSVICNDRYQKDYQYDFTYPVNALELVFSAHPRYYSKQFLKTSKKN